MAKKTEFQYLFGFDGEPPREVELPPLPGAPTDPEPDVAPVEVSSLASDTPMLPNALPPPTLPDRRERPASTSMHATALVFLDHPLARKLAVAWSSCRGFDDDDDWITSAGLSRSVDAVRLCKALKVNGICRDGGVTDALALQYIGRLVASSLKPLKKEDK